MNKQNTTFSITMSEYDGVLSSSIYRLYVSNDYLVLYKLRSLPSLHLWRKEWPRLGTLQTAELLLTPPSTENATWVSAWWSVHPQWRVCSIVYSSITFLSLQLVLRRVLVCSRNQCVFVILLLRMICNI